MRKSFTPSHKNKSFESPMLKNTSRPTSYILNQSIRSSFTNSTTNFKTKLSKQLKNSHIESEVEKSKENIGIEDNQMTMVTPLPIRKKIKLNNSRPPLFPISKATPQLTINEEKKKDQETNEKTERKLYYNVVW